MSKEKLSRPPPKRKYLKPQSRLSETDMIKIISKETRYHVYEVRDILNEYHRQFQIQLLKGHEISIQGLFGAKLVERKSRLYYSRLKDKMEMSRDAIKMKITPSRAFLVQIAEYFGFDPRKGYKAAPILVQKKELEGFE